MERGDDSVTVRLARRARLGVGGCAQRYGVVDALWTIQSVERRRASVSKWIRGSS